MAQSPAPRSLTDLRLLDGPNLYFPRPAAKVTLDCTALIELTVPAARAVAATVGLGTTRPGAAGSVFRQRFAIRLLTQLVRQLARAGGVTRLAVRCRTGVTVTELVVAYPWRNSRRAEALAYGLAGAVDEMVGGPERGHGGDRPGGRRAQHHPGRGAAPADPADHPGGRGHRYERQDHHLADDRPHRPAGRKVGGLVEHRRGLRQR